ncbi:hypothetical protein BKA67DRAFT_552976 [Truncatella angustata]|uniref:Uncharacterized protein n=1 Tax=Truncatella angustata TaxID=152316 RepID=A0A9P8ZZ31_9PEZI|nr:uncharacterized protein BKA67DRAFT_552976 [Truncatella angustata]KAH6656762.1 hypothetical protein BKA67DRAFT_552976 [Truncatella angustata]KAH8196309.1 hypothetical protein TruAng_009521 [Truncatella angustata]
MDVAYKQHSNQARRKNHSSTNLSHLTLAPLTLKLPLTDPEDLPEFVASPLQHNVSYLQGKSAPTTPRLLARSPARGNSRSRRSSIHEIKPDADTLTKSKSASHLAGFSSGQKHRASGTYTPTTRRRGEEHTTLSIEYRNDSDWMLRAGALISTEMRESKGQAWLVTRQSSTSLAGLRDAEEEAFAREFAREKELASRRGSRRGSLAHEGTITSPTSHVGSRSHSRKGSRNIPRTPLRDHLDDGYFGHFGQEISASEEYIQGPDFVSLDEKLEAVQIDTSQADEATVRRLVKQENAGMGSWMGNLIGWSLFSVEEQEESDIGEGDESEAGEVRSNLSHSPSRRRFEDVASASEPRMPPPKADDGGWNDAAWLLSVASKVLL